MREQNEGKHQFKTRQLPVQSDHDNRPDDFDSRLDKLGAKLDEQKAAKEAEVKMTGPNLLIMLACIIVIMGPILLPIVYGGGLGFE